MGDNDPIDACEIGTMVSSSLIYLFFIYYFYLFIYFHFLGKQGMHEAGMELCHLRKCLSCTPHPHYPCTHSPEKCPCPVCQFINGTELLSFLEQEWSLPFFFYTSFPFCWALNFWSILGEKVEKVIKIIMLKSLRWVGSRRSFPFISFSESYKKKFLFVSGSL